MEGKTIEDLKFPSYVLEIGVIEENANRQVEYEKKLYNVIDDKNDNEWELENAKSKKRIKVNPDKLSKKSQIGVTNAQLMFIHENGSPLHHIPARPVLKLTLEWAIKSGILFKAVAKSAAIFLATGNVEEMDKEMEKLALQFQNHARRIIYSNDGQLAPNSPLTIKEKGDNHPLFDTGQLARSITCRAIRIS